MKISLSGVNITNSCLASQKKKKRERETENFCLLFAIIAFVSVCVCVCVLKTLENILSLQFPLEILITTSMVLL